jgi:hypothetical protein
VPAAIDMPARSAVAWLVDRTRSASATAIAPGPTPGARSGRARRIHTRPE